MLALVWQYLRGRAVATDPTDRQRAEWPPHPDRVLQALVASWGEKGARSDEQDSLDWLLSLPPPALAVPLEVGNASVVKTYVPVNDVRGSARVVQLGVLPDRRPRKARYFPNTHVGDAPCALIWPDADAGNHALVLAELCRGVTHIGHSSSLVRMWLSDDPPQAVLEPSAAGGDFMLRVSGPGRLRDLVDAHAGGGAGWRRPPWAAWQAYRRIGTLAAVAQGDFSERLITLRRIDGAPLTLVHSPALVRAMRGLLIAASDDQPGAKRLVSGHEPDGSMMRSPHVAILPLGFVGDSSSSYADGHVMGLGLALPRELNADQELEVLGVVSDAFRDAGQRELRLGELGTLSLAVEEREIPPQALRPATWIQASLAWATVTPIVLDRSTPRRHRDVDGWVRDQLVQACVDQGLPRPSDVEVGDVARWIGVPPARAFPTLLRKDGSRRWHVHACLSFPAPVRGPLVLGAGRYRGYGLCKPQKR